MAISKIVTNSVDSGVTLTSPVINTITSAAATALTLQSAGTTAITVDTSQNVGIGTSSPTVYGGFTTLEVGATSGNAGLFSAKHANGNAIMYNSAGVASFGSTGAYPTTFITQSVERMRIDSSGRLGVGTTPYSWASGWTPIDLANSASIVSTGDGNLVSTGNCYYNGSSWIRKIAGYAALTEANSGNAGTIKTYTAGSSTAGSSITLTAGPYVANLGTSWTNSSDERLKDIIEPITDATNKVGQLRAVIGKFKTDPDDKRRSFLIAQDVQIVLPEAVDATDPDSLGVQYTDVIPLLVAAIKEQQALIIQLQADVAALKGIK